MDSGLPAGHEKHAARPDARADAGHVAGRPEWAVGHVGLRGSRYGGVRAGAGAAGARGRHGGHGQAGHGLRGPPDAGHVEDGDGRRFTKGPRRRLGAALCFYGQTPRGRLQNISVVRRRRRPHHITSGGPRISSNVACARRGGGAYDGDDAAGRVHRARRGERRRRRPKDAPPHPLEHRPAPDRGQIQTTQDDERGVPAQVPQPRRRPGRVNCGGLRGK
mmetsp:Transcript_3705/g.11358  ORF Transcript_3705/g.11358 Transcript_3705/m.11358 type:complete len:219 (-) Transcript_3705:681-1337(-)